MSNLIERPETTALPVVTEKDQTFDLLQRAIESGTSPEALEKLVALQERIMDRNAESAYTAAMAAFQSRCPAIEKRHVVKDRSGRRMYAFAPLEDIVAQIRDLMAELGLSYAFDSAESASGIEVFCTIRHRDGYKSTSSVFIPTTSGHNTNASQNMGIQLAYGKRYALIGALGIVTADEDQDGETQVLKPISENQVAELISLADEVGADHQKFLKYLGARTFNDIPQRDYDRAIGALEAKRKR